MPTPSNKIQTLRQQIDNLEENLRLIAERKSEYVEPSSIPLQLKRDARETYRQLEELRTQLANLESAREATPSATVGEHLDIPSKSTQQAQFRLLYPVMLIISLVVLLVLVTPSDLIPWRAEDPNLPVPNPPSDTITNTFVINEWQNRSPGASPHEALFTESTRQMLYRKLSASPDLQGISWEVQQMTPAARRVPTYWLEGSYEYRDKVRLSVQIFGENGVFVAEATAVATDEEQSEIEQGDAAPCLLDLQNRLALDIFEKLDQDPPVDADLRVDEIPTSSCEALRLNNQAVDFILAGNLVVAQSLLDNALDLDPTYADAHNNIAHVYELQGKTAEADAEYIRAINLDPRNPLYLYNLGRLREIDGNYEDAVPIYRGAIELDPLYTIAYNNLAFTYLQMDRPDLALETLQPALGLDATPGVAAYLYKNLGRSYLLLDQPQEAIPALEAANQYHVAAYDQPFPEALFYLAQSFSETNETDSACTTLSEYGAVAEEDEPQRQIDAHALGAALGC